MTAVRIPWATLGLCLCAPFLVLPYCLRMLLACCTGLYQWKRLTMDEQRRCARRGRMTVPR